MKRETKTQRVYKGKSLIAFPCDYTVVDIETNGFYADVCEIIEISAVKYRNGEKTAVFSQLIKPNQRISRFITMLTGITNEMVKNGADISEALLEFEGFIEKDIILGYNVNFDINFLYDNMMRCHGRPLTNDFVDVLRLARKALPELENHKQTTVAEHYGIDTKGAHRAEKDCLICNAVYDCIRECWPYAQGL